ncbi:MAG TPA: c-type cytochrome [Gemmatimonadaceae bacterium]|jgi:mono/diheme cytochrome c family protein|nr:c-type cytochrome [Gemmatimonadaceae bacterium]
MNWSVAVCLAIALAVSGGSARAQGAAAKPQAAPVTSGLTTLSGVYTAEQASRGKDVYAGACRSCHTPVSHTGATFAKWWRGRQLSDLFGFISTNMPKNDPGSLAPEDVADVTAYLLKMNAMPVGPAELPPDIDSLKKVRIETKPSRPSAAKTSPAKRKKP